MSQPTQPAQPAAIDSRKLTVAEQVVCALPLALVIIGGALGGLCGGLAWGLNQKIMRTKMSPPSRYGLVIASLIGAAILYFALAFALVALFPNLFVRR